MEFGTVIAIILSELETGLNENNKVKKVICFLRHNTAHWYNARRSCCYFFCKLKGGGATLRTMEHGWKGTAATHLRLV